jgi:hypothetical protein
MKIIPVLGSQSQSNVTHRRCNVKVSSRVMVLFSNDHLLHGLDTDDTFYS